ncbi:MAG: hypothetical protein IPO97_00485 [Sphingomonadales bacterium]|nr:hypothetical protein [Sphingomonadales bacterium]
MFSVTAGDLRSARIKVPPGVADSAYVALSSLPGVTAKYDEANRGIALGVPDPLAGSAELTVTEPRDKVDLSKIAHTDQCAAQLPPSCEQRSFRLPARIRWTARR